MAIECGDQRITYLEILQNVNRFGSALRTSLGVRLEERVLLLMLDRPEMIYAFFGTIKIGAVPVPTQHAVDRLDYDYVLATRAPAVRRRQRGAAAAAQAVPRAALRCLRHIVVVGGERRRVGMRFAAFGSRARADSRRGANEPRRGGVLAVLVGQHRPSQGLRAPAARHGRARRNLRAGRARDRPTGPLLQRRQALLRLWAGQRLYFPFAVGATTHPLARRADARRTSSASSSATGRRCSSRCRRTTRCCWPTRGRARASICRAPAARLRRRVAAAGALRPLSHAIRRSDPGWHRLDGDPAHLHLQPPGAVPRGIERRVVPGYEARLVDETAHAVRRRRDRATC